MPEPHLPARDVPLPSSREVTRTTAADQIIEQLRTQILTGARPLGAKLPPERELRVEFGVSSPTIREALRALNSMGLIEARQGSGAYVAPNLSRTIASAMGMITQLENVGLGDLLGLQGVLNRYAADLAVSRATEEDIARLLEQAEATAHCATLEDVTTTVPAFIMAFADAAHQPLLAGLSGFLVTLLVQVEVSSYKRKSPKFWRDWAKETSKYRLAIARALERRDLTELNAALATFHDAVPARLQSIPALRDAHMSDPALASVLAKIVSGR
jgi:GntR family transcriptional regulator, transcriptional repressor for pyruvate dehydrogenase complex